MGLPASEMRKVFAKEAEAQVRGDQPAQLEGGMQMMVPPPLIIGEIQLGAVEHMNIGLTPDGLKVLQFIQGPLTVTVKIPNELKSHIIKGLTGIEMPSAS